MEILKAPVVDFIDLRVTFDFAFADRKWHAKVKPEPKMGNVVLRVSVRPGKSLLALDAESSICEMLADDLLQSPAPPVKSALRQLYEAAMANYGFRMPYELEHSDEARFDHHLINRHPKIFPGGPRSESGQGWFFACGPGWSDLIDTLCARIQQHVDGHKIEQVVATHVKQKFGGLRFGYTLNHDDQRIAGMVEMACAMSLHICEVCGARGNQINTDGWYRTRCEEHQGTAAI